MIARPETFAAPPQAYLDDGTRGQFVVEAELSQASAMVKRKGAKAQGDRVKEAGDNGVDC